MLFYKVYMEEDDRTDRELIGVLPERRENTGRVIRESVLHWIKIVFGETFNGNKKISFKETPY